MYERGVKKVQATPSLASNGKEACCHGIDQGLCSTPAVAFEAFEPLVYKLRRPLHLLGPSVFVLLIQSIRLIDSSDKR